MLQNTLQSSDFMGVDIVFDFVSLLSQLQLQNMISLHENYIGCVAPVSSSALTASYEVSEDPERVYGASDTTYSRK